MTHVFTPHETGTAEDSWQPLVARASRLEVPGPGQTVVVVAAHPDDESLGAGGLIALAAANGAAVRVVVATDGEASHPDSPTHDRVRLAAIRRDEVRAAVDLLSDRASITLLGLPDGALLEHQAALAHLLEPHLVDATHVVCPWSGDRHPDHEACAAAVARLVGGRRDVAQWQYPVWAWHWADADELPWSRIGRIVLTPAARDAKRAAMAAYVSQHSSLSPEPGDESILPPTVLRHFDRDAEAFVVGIAPAADPSYFDALYDRAPDPWGLADRFYERRKRNVIMASLPSETFARAFEPGCATGELSVRLADRCAELVCWDVAPAAVERTRSRSAAHVRVERGQIPDEWPDGTFDLVVLSEVGYYCTDLDELVRRVRSCLTGQGLVVACHWRRAAPDHPQSGDSVHAALAAGLDDLHHVVQHEEPDFLLDVWSSAAASVAEVEGIIA